MSTTEPARFVSSVFYLVRLHRYPYWNPLSRTTIHPERERSVTIQFANSSTHPNAPARPRLRFGSELICQILRVARGSFAPVRLL